MDVEQQHKANSDRKRKRKHKMRTRSAHVVDDSLNAVGMNILPDDVIIAILSHMSWNEASRTSILSRRWRHLWKFSSGTLELDDKSIFSPKTLISVDSNITTRTTNMRKKFIARVNRVLKLHQGMSFNGLIIRFAHVRSRPSGRPPSYIDGWIYFAMRQRLKTFELNFSMYSGRHPYYGFPKLDKLLSRSRDVDEFGFGSLRSLKLVDVDIRDEVVEYFLVSCPHLEQLCIRASCVTRNLRVVDPLPSLTVLEISNCNFIQDLEISAMNLVSCTYIGNRMTFPCEKIPFKEIPNLSELTLGGRLAGSFIYEPNKHSGYSDQLTKLSLNIPNMGFVGSDSLDVRWRTTGRSLPRLWSLKHLDLNVASPVGRSILFFTLLIKVAPLLNEFRIKVSYIRTIPSDLGVGFPQVSPKLESYGCSHKNLKAVKMSGYVGCSRDDKFVLQLLEIAPSLETVTINTKSKYYEEKPWVCAKAIRCTKETGQECICTTQGSGARTKIEAKTRAERLKFRFSPKTVLIVD